MLKKFMVLFTTFAVIVGYSCGGIIGTVYAADPQVRIVAAEDAYIDNSSWSRNNNSRNELLVGKGTIKEAWESEYHDVYYLSYIKFDVSDCKGYGGAKFSVWCKNSGTTKLGIYGIPDTSWNEMTLNWKTAPGIVTSETKFDSITTKKLGEITTTGTGRYDLDISEYLAQNMANGAITIGIAEENNDIAFLGSREDTDNRDRKPYLYLRPDVSALIEKIAQAHSLSDSVAVGPNDGECTQQSKDELNSAIAAAEVVSESWDSTEAQISDAVEMLEQAMETFRDALANKSKNIYDETLKRAKSLQSKVTTDQYSQSAIDAFSEAIAAAEQLAAEGSYRQAAVDLENAIDALVAERTSTPGIVLSCVADAYIQKGSPDTNYAGSNASTNLITGNADDCYLAYLKFDISEFPGEYGRAKLRFFSKDSSSYTLGIYGLSDTSWEEGSLTWNNAPNRSESGFSGEAVKIGEITTTGRQNYEFDLGAYFKAHNTDDYIAIGIAMETSNTNAYLSQRENADPSMRPVLTLGLNASALESVITEAQKLYDETLVGLGAGHCTKQAKDNLNAAISAAKTVYADYSKTTFEYGDAAAALNAAIEAFKDAMYCIDVVKTDLTIDGVKADSLAAGKVKVTVKVKNVGTNSEQLNIFIALMQGTEELASLEDIEVQTITVDANNDMNCEGTVNITDVADAFIKVFVWDDNMQPKTKPLTIE